VWTNTIGLVRDSGLALARENLVDWELVAVIGCGVALARRAARGVGILVDGEMVIFDPAHPDNLLTIWTMRREGTVVVFAADAGRILLLRRDGVLEIFDGSAIGDGKWK